LELIAYACDSQRYVHNVTVLRDGPPVLDVDVYPYTGEEAMPDAGDRLHTLPRLLAFLPREMTFLRPAAWKGRDPDRPAIPGNTAPAPACSQTL